MTKLTSLSNAVRATVNPGDTLVFAFTHNRSHAAAFEVARQFRDKRCLNLVATGLLEYATILQSAGVISKLESAFAGATYPAPAPSRELQTAFAEQPGSDPDWTNLTMTLRLMAGAMGWPFIPTNSLAGSGLWRDQNRAVIVDPFSGKSMPVIAALNPDVAFLHAAVADTEGNVIIHGPDAEEGWSVLAAKRVVVTADRVVSPEEFRAIGPRNGIPGSVVTHVVLAPFGAHPQGQFVWSAEEGVASYAEDYDFRLMLRGLSREPMKLRAWVEDWVFGTTHDSYLARLGLDRLGELRDAAINPRIAAPADPKLEASPEERAAVLAMRIAEREVKAGRAETLFAGIGLAHLAAWAAETRCRADGVATALIAETGMIGFRPMLGDPYLFNRPNAASSLFHSSFLRTLGVFAGANAKACLAMLAAGQIDAKGNINSSRTAKGQLIVGSGGANDLAVGNSSVLVVMPLKVGRMAQELPFVTSPIRQLTGVATDLGLLTRNEEGRLQIASVMCDHDRMRETIDSIIVNAGFAVPGAGDVTCEPPPSPEELALIRSFDPSRAILA